MKLFKINYSLLIQKLFLFQAGDKLALCPTHPQPDGGIPGGFQWCGAHLPYQDFWWGKYQIVFSPSYHFCVWLHDFIGIGIKKRYHQWLLICINILLKYYHSNLILLILTIEGHYLRILLTIFPIHPSEWTGTAHVWHCLYWCEGLAKQHSLQGRVSPQPHCHSVVLESKSGCDCLSWPGDPAPVVEEIWCCI